MNPTLPSVRQKLIWSLLFLGFVVLGAVLVWRTRPAPTHSVLTGSVLPVLGHAPDFSLTERSGRTFSKKELLGKPWIADFIFTNCAGQCPLMSLEMEGLQRSFSKEAGLRFVSFTVDPKRDTPAILSEYADRYQAEKDRWFFLTGPPKEINRILGGFFLSPVDHPAMHSIRFILVDAEGEMRSYYDSSDPQSMKQLMHDAKFLVRPLTPTLSPKGRGKGEG